MPGFRPPTELDHPEVRGHRLDGIPVHGASYQLGTAASPVRPRRVRQSKLRDEDDLASGVPLLELRVGRSNLVERVGRSDGNGNRAFGREVSHFSQHLGVGCRSATSVLTAACCANWNAMMVLIRLRSAPSSISFSHHVDAGRRQNVTATLTTGEIPGGTRHVERRSGRVLGIPCGPVGSIPVDVGQSKSAVPKALGALSYLQPLPCLGGVRYGHPTPTSSHGREQHGDDRQQRQQVRSLGHHMTFGPGRSARPTLNWVGERADPTRRGDARSAGPTPAAGPGDRLSRGAHHQRRQHHPQRRAPDACPGPACHVEPAPVDRGLLRHGVRRPAARRRDAGRPVRPQAVLPDRAHRVRTGVDRRSPIRIGDDAHRIPGPHGSRCRAHDPDVAGDHQRHLP